MLSEPGCTSRQVGGIRAQVGYRRRPGAYGGKPSVVVDNTLTYWDKRLKGIKVLWGLPSFSVANGSFLEQIHITLVHTRMQ